MGWSKIDTVEHMRYHDSYTYYKVYSTTKHKPAWREYWKYHDEATYRITQEIGGFDTNQKMSSGALERVILSLSNSIEVMQIKPAVTTID